MAASTAFFRLGQPTCRLKTISFVQELRYPPFHSKPQLSYLSSTHLHSSFSPKTSKNSLQYGKSGSSIVGLSNSAAVQPISLFSHRLGHCHNTPSIVVPVRKYTSEPPERKKIKTLVVVRNPITIIRDLLYSWLIKVYFDQDFSLYEFADAAKRAIVIISQELSQGAFDNLKGLVQNDALIAVKEQCQKLSEEDRHTLARYAADLVAYPQDIRVHYDTDDVTKIIKVKIQMKCIAPNTKEASDKPIVHCEYEFYRDFSPGIEPQWTVTDIIYPIFDNKEKHN